MTDISEYPQGKEALSFAISDLPISEDSKTILREHGVTKVEDLLRKGRTCIVSMIGEEMTDEIVGETRQMNLNSIFEK